MFGSECDSKMHVRKCLKALCMIILNLDGGLHSTSVFSIKMDLTGLNVVVVFVQTTDTACKYIVNTDIIIN